MVRVFANGPGDWGSIPGRVIPKTQKMVRDASWLNTQQYKVGIKGKVKQSKEAIEKRAFGSPSTKVNNLNRLIGQEGRLFANGLGDRGSIPGRFMPKT